MSSYVERIMQARIMAYINDEDPETMKEELTAIANEGSMHYGNLVAEHILNKSPRLDWPIIISVLRQSANLMEADLAGVEKELLSRIKTDGMLIKVAKPKENEE